MQGRLEPGCVLPKRSRSNLRSSPEWPRISRFRRNLARQAPSGIGRRRRDRRQAKWRWLRGRPFLPRPSAPRAYDDSRSTADERAGRRPHAGRKATSREDWWRSVDVADFRRPPPKCGAFRLQPRGSPLRQTGCWRKTDSNPRSRVMDNPFRNPRPIPPPPSAAQSLDAAPYGRGTEVRRLGAGARRIRTLGPPVRAQQFRRGPFVRGNGCRNSRPLLLRWPHGMRRSGRRPCVDGGSRLL
jgi:hypothetical protein